MRFQDRTIVVTGGGSGIGRATAERALAEGAAVVAVDRDADALAALKAAAGSDLLATLAGDVTDAGLAAEGMRLAGGFRRPVKGLVTAAGISASDSWCRWSGWPWEIHTKGELVAAAICFSVSGLSWAQLPK